MNHPAHLPPTRQRFHLSACGKVGFLLLLCICLLPLTALGAAVEADALTFYQTSLAALQQDAGAWSKRLIPLLPEPTITVNGDEVTYQVTVPSMKAGAWEGGTGIEKLQSLLASFLSPQGGETVVLTALRSDAGELVWKKKAGMDALSAAIKAAAASGKRSYGSKTMVKAVEEALFPAFAAMPKKRPDAPVAFSPADWYGEMMGAAFDLTPEEANARFPYLAMLVTVSKADVADTPMAAALKLKVRNWTFMVEQAIPLAKAKVETLMGAKDQERSVYAGILRDAMAETFLRVYYGTKKPETVELTVDLAAVAVGGVAASEPLQQWFSAYSRSVDHAIDQLMAYGATLPYYPRAAMINAGVLSGGEDADGIRVSFRTPAGSKLHGFVKINREDDFILTGFVRSGVRLSVKLSPGTYDVYCGLGEDWFGENVIFGKEAAYGRFSLTVVEGSAYDVTLSPEGAGMEAASFEEVAAHP